uniref:Uncharacterized protein n=1 Tax=Panagrolaimus sp. PS1159 TaxID=55785 RepID=A0AC35FS68_9BILA
MAFLKVFLILAFCVTVAQSIHCYVCENDSCGRAQGFAMENCGDHVSKCYTLNNFNNQIYRVGCLPTNCDQIQRKSGDQCIPCDSNNCNGVSIDTPKIGGGTSYNSSNTLSTLNAIIFAFVLSFLAKYIYA